MMQNDHPAWKFSRLFELAEPLASNGSANAAMLTFDRASQEYAKGDSDSTFTVYDTIGMSGEAGTRGRALNLLGRWFVVEMQC